MSESSDLRPKSQNSRRSVVSVFNNTNSTEKKNVEPIYNEIEMQDLSSIVSDDDDDIAF